MWEIPFRAERAFLPCRAFGHASSRQYFEKRSKTHLELGFRVANTSRPVGLFEPPSSCVCGRAHSVMNSDAQFKQSKPHNVEAAIFSRVWLSAPGFPKRLTSAWVGAPGSTGVHNWWGRERHGAFCHGVHDKWSGRV